MLQGIYKRKEAEEDRNLFRNFCSWVHPMPGRTGEFVELTARAARMVKGRLQARTSDTWALDAECGIGHH